VGEETVRTKPCSTILKETIVCNLGGLGEKDHGALRKEAGVEIEDRVAGVLYILSKKLKKKTNQCGTTTGNLNAKKGRRE